MSLVVEGHSPISPIIENPPNFFYIECALGLRKPMSDYPVNQ